MNNQRIKRWQVVLTIVICIGMVIAMSTKALAAQHNQQVGSYDTTTIALHTSSYATGTFEATFRGGAAVIPSSQICVTPKTSTGAGCGYASSSGGLSCGAQANSYGPVVAYSYVDSYWLGACVCNQFHD